MEYEIVVGLEVHAELSTKSKIYCSCTTEFGGDVNTHTCPICTGMPGTLPVLNEKVVEYAVKAGLATNCNIAEYSKQDRKNYFYPDLPKSYQISQYDLPLCYHGYVTIEVEGEQKRIGITRIHIEEDAGKLMHDEDGAASLVDYNRCGIALIEIVSEPDMRSANEVKTYLENLKAILEYINVSDCKMQEGSLRADVNLSVRRKGESKFGTRTEMKNLNSFKAIVRAIEGEAARQIKEIKEGRAISQETRRWDDEKETSYSMRSKEETHDYRYFPEPDLMPIEVDAMWKEKIKNNLPELPEDRKKRYIHNFLLPEYDASILTSSKVLADFFEKTAVKSKNAKSASNWIMGEVLRVLKERQMEIEEVPFSPEHLAKLITLIDNGTISGTIGKKVFEEMFTNVKDPEIIVKEKGLEVISDEKEMLNIVEKVLKKNSKSVKDYKIGKKKAFGFLMGQVMKETEGKADPKIANKILKNELG
ncbi:Asp-tRNA(Asn)/Glu-tRNA(Gln) amidotransferase subunit GatB [Herbivorax sp. ANBcel31]|uniref:Asp-tRNA(Asn)/Glu-tRNA(Gln) amidotransferase subunit GatB n=1 Tax=Herbivorax sp. ANBcel31 TaxID=3069754 RepID=UPI0027B39766|nr:Asp-tRNA(Asn)/Glu-tRNA(Gln) amidotransferase subunit GatB [Herbivorax sp. ANBcel31]MDQ2085949.1 Asp-tRNA(Asn)/Glu-tRNA(Gln) amidotransferase subunit GatB [Herbivorax sp. ANBcel31]